MAATISLEVRLLAVMRLEGDAAALRRFREDDAKEWLTKVCCCSGELRITRSSPPVPDARERKRIGAGPLGAKAPAIDFLSTSIQGASPVSLVCCDRACAFACCPRRD